MLDDLRNSATYEDEPESSEEYDYYEDAEEKRAFLGMTAGQRFVIALVLLLMVCVLGSFCLIVTEKVVPPL